MKDEFFEGSGEGKPITSSDVIPAAAIIGCCWSWRIIVRVAVEGDLDAATGGTGRHGRGDKCQCGGEA